MELYEIKIKILEVWSIAHVVVQKYRHTKKFAKQIIALVIKEDKNFSDEKLAKFLGEDPIGKILGYSKTPHPSVFSKVRKRSDTRILQEVYEWFLQDKMKEKQVHLIAQDSTDISAYSKDDKDARFGHKTPSKKEQIASKSTKKSFVFGYKLHVIADVETEIPIALEIAPANRNDKIFFHELYNTVKERFAVHMKPNAKFLADAAYDSTDIYQELHYDGVKPLIVVNGRGHYKSSKPKDKEYGKRWAIERIFSRLKEVFGLAKNRFIGIKKVTMHIYSCILAYLLRYG